MKASFLLIVALLCSAVLIAAQTRSNAVPADFPLSVWMEHKQVTQVPWTVSIGKAYFRSDLRQELQIGVSIRSANLEKSVETHDLTIFVRVMDGATPITSVHSVVPDDSSRFASAQTAGRGALWTQIALVRPGKYKLELALLDKATGRYNARYEDVLVSGDPSDPLEQALQQFPRFEFVETAKVENDGPPPAPLRPTILNGVNIGVPLGRAKAANLSGRDLGLSTDLPPSFVINKSGKLNLSVVTILSPPEVALDDPYYLSSFQTNQTTFLSAFSRLIVVHGTSQLTGVDLTNRTLVFDRRDMKDVTREMLEDAINKDANTVSVEALAGKTDQGRFFRDVLRTQFEIAEKETSGAEHVIIVVAARSKFPKGSSVSPLSPERDCHCRVIYVRFALQPNETDDIDSLLKSYKPRVFEPLDWQEFRKDFATIYAQLLR